MLLQQSIEHVSIVYTCTTYFAMRLSMSFIQQCLVNVCIQYMPESYCQNKVTTNNHNTYAYIKLNHYPTHLNYL